MAGRHPKPTRLKIIAGNPGKRPLNEDEPEPTLGIPEMPEWLSEFPRAVENWERESKILDHMRIMTEADWGVLTGRCYIYSQLVEVALDVKKEGRISTYQKVDPLGNEFYEFKHNPKVKQLENLLKEYRIYGNLLGLDPSNRSKVKAGKRNKENPWEEL